MDDSFPPAATRKTALGIVGSRITTAVRKALRETLTCLTTHYTIFTKHGVPETMSYDDDGDLYSSTGRFIANDDTRWTMLIDALRIRDSGVIRVAVNKEYLESGVRDTGHLTRRYLLQWLTTALIPELVASGYNIQRSSDGMTMTISFDMSLDEAVKPEVSCP